MIGVVSTVGYAIASPTVNKVSSLRDFKEVFCRDAITSTSSATARVFTRVDSVCDDWMHRLQIGASGCVIFKTKKPPIGGFFILNIS